MEISWNRYKEIVSEQIGSGNNLIYRGQRDSSWRLISTLRRTPLINSIAEHKKYLTEFIPAVKNRIMAWDSRRIWDLSKSEDAAEFLAYLQHNGFPTPLLDWTFSPYIAAYFAFESLDHFYPQSDKVAIFSFDQKLWSRIYKQVLDINHDQEHVSILQPSSFGNHKLSVQQGIFTYSNVYDIQTHIELHEKHKAFKGEKCLVKYTLDKKEKCVWRITNFARLPLLIR